MISNQPVVGDSASWLDIMLCGLVALMTELQEMNRMCFLDKHIKKKNRPLRQQMHRVVLFWSRETLQRGWLHGGRLGWPHPQIEFQNRDKKSCPLVAGCRTALVVPAVMTPEKIPKIWIHSLSQPLYKDIPWIFGRERINYLPRLAVRILLSLHFQSCRHSAHVGWQRDSSQSLRNSVEKMGCLPRYLSGCIKALRDLEALQGGWRMKMNHRWDLNVRLKRNSI